MFRGSVKGTGYSLHSPISPSLPLPCVCVCHHISTGVYLRELSPWDSLYLPGLEAGESSPSSAELKMSGTLPPLQIYAFLPWKGTSLLLLTHILLTWRIWWAPNNASWWQIGLNWAFKWLSELMHFCGTSEIIPRAPRIHASSLLRTAPGFSCCSVVVVVSSCLQWFCGSNRYCNYEFSNVSSIVIMWGGAPVPFFRRFFAILRQATFSFVMSVPPSVCMEQLGSHCTDFHEIWYLGISRKSIGKIQISLKSDKNRGYFTWRPIYIF